MTDYDNLSTKTLSNEEPIVTFKFAGLAHSLNVHTEHRTSKLTVITDSLASGSIF